MRSVDTLRYTRDRVKMWNGRANLLYSTDRPIDRSTEKDKRGKKKWNFTLDAFGTILAPEMPSQWGFGALYSRDRHAPSPLHEPSYSISGPKPPVFSLSLFPRLTGPLYLIPSWFPTTAVPKALRCPRFSSSFVLVPTSTLRFVYQFMFQSMMHCYRYNKVHHRHVFGIIDKLIRKR